MWLQKISSADALSLHDKRSGTRLEPFSMRSLLAKCRRLPRVCSGNFFVTGITTTYFATVPLYSFKYCSIPKCISHASLF